MTLDEIAKLEALLAKATPGEWQARRMIHADTNEPITPEQVGEYVTNSVLKSEVESGTREFVFIHVQKPDGPADVALIGNGPTRGPNAALIVAAVNSLPALLAAAREREELQARIARLGYEQDSADLRAEKAESERDALAARVERLREALLLARGVGVEVAGCNADDILGQPICPACVESGRYLTELVDTALAADKETP